MNGSIRCRKCPLIELEMCSTTLSNSKLMLSSFLISNKLLEKREMDRLRRGRKTQDQSMVLVQNLVVQCQRAQVKEQAKCSQGETRVKLLLQEKILLPSLKLLLLPLQRLLCFQITLRIYQRFHHHFWIHLVKMKKIGTHLCSILTKLSFITLNIKMTASSLWGQAVFNSLKPWQSTTRL